MRKWHYALWHFIFDTLPSHFVNIAVRHWKYYVTRWKTRDADEYRLRWLRVGKMPTSSILRRQRCRLRSSLSLLRHFALRRELHLLSRTLRQPKYYVVMHYGDAIIFVNADAMMHWCADGWCCISGNISLPHFDISFEILLFHWWQWAFSGHLPFRWCRCIIAFRQADYRETLFRWCREGHRNICISRAAATLSFAVVFHLHLHFISFLFVFHLLFLDVK